MPGSRSSELEDKVQKNFDLDKYLGKWYEIYRTSNIPFEKGKNITAEYTKIENSEFIKVVNTQYNKKYEFITGEAKVIDKKIPAILGIKFYWFLPYGDYKIMYTDYDRISLVLSEWSIFGCFYHRYAWILSRKPSITPEEEEKAFKLFDEVLGLKRNAFVKTEQTASEN
ncbi:hypothetical protein GINT2_001520 [Glugoides intestinalis]